MSIQVKIINYNPEIVECICDVKYHPGYTTIHTVIEHNRLCLAHNQPAEHKDQLLLW